MPYSRINFKDHVVERPNTYTQSTNTDGSITFAPSFGKITRQGTPLNAETLNRMDEQVYNLTDVLEALQANFLDLTHPIGSLYWSKEPTSPAELFGGTWEAVTDTFIYAAGTKHAIGSTGGAETVVLTANEMPSHTHTFTGSAVTSASGGASHTHTFTGKAVTSGSSNAAHRHTFTGSAVTSASGGASHTHTFTGSEVSTGNQSASHSHTFTGSAVTSGGQSVDHVHYAYYGGRFFEVMSASDSSGMSYSAAIQTGGGWFGSSYKNVYPHTKGVNTGHTHSVTAKGSIGNQSASHSHKVTAKGSIAAATASHTHSVTAAGTVASANAAHTHSVTASGTIAAATASHTHSVTAAGTNAKTGGGAAHNNMPPFKAYYCWERIA